ncbi:hypothetical protein MNBD_GAMMA24-2740 [hydrothermal vent metagenome]|uniref:Adenosyl-chloride synthase n=1 Tax=hydrothermal vent metagenome TaxID=652676 RepID=A0A3B1BPH1_9ZZZZ
MILLFTDYGWQAAYVGQLKAAIYTVSRAAAVIDLQHDAPIFNPRAAAYLLASLIDFLPADALILAVVDPGVGDVARRPLVMKADGRYYVGPDNGIFNVIAKQASRVEFWRIDWQPSGLTKTFHGRDLFAPVAAMLDQGDKPELARLEAEKIGFSDWSSELAEVIYIDNFGNVISGLKGASVSTDMRVHLGEREVCYAETFSAAGEGEGFWHINANGLVEIAVNQGTAALAYNLKIGDPVYMYQTEV